MNADLRDGSTTSGASTPAVAVMGSGLSLSLAPE
jgi:hypothetical protein